MRAPLNRFVYLLSMLVAASASAVPVDTAIDGLWQEFRFSETGTFAESCAVGRCGPSESGNSEEAGIPPWTVTALDPLLLTVTDAFSIGDEFRIFDFGSAIGQTSFAANTNGFDSCGSDPEVCVQDSRVSKGFFNLAPGPHSLTIQVIDSAYGQGAAYFRLDTIPEPGTGLLVIAGLLGLAGWRSARA